MKKQNNTKNREHMKFQKGFTIVELLLYMGVFSMLLTVLLSLFGTILSTHAESQVTSSVDQDGNYALARLSYDIHRSTAITSPSIGGQGNSLTLTINGVGDTYTIVGNSLVFTDNSVTPPHVDQINSVGTQAAVTFTVLGNPASTPVCTPNCKPSVNIALTLTSTGKRDAGLIQSQQYITTAQSR